MTFAAPIIQVAVATSAAANPLTITVAAATPGNTLVLLYASPDSNAGWTVSGGGAVSWVDQGASGGVNVSLGVWRCIVGASPTTTVLLNTGVASRVDAWVLELPSGWTLDQKNTATGTGTTFSSGSVTPLFPNEIVLGVSGCFNMNAGVSGGWTDLGKQTYGGAGYIVETAIAAASTTWTAASSQNWDGDAVSFRPPAFPHTSPLPQLLPQ